ncbi:MAG: hypothetical protein HC896_04085 [Bacteroidales bacterium]|nr:hypothetical protein [Bacteroidales bacterium]
MTILKPMLCLALLSASLAHAKAQQAVLTAGGSASSSGGSISYSVGQVAYNHNAGANGSTSEGVQQNFEISVVSGLHQTTGIQIECLVFPNPTSSSLMLRVDIQNQESLQYKLFDVNARVLSEGNIVGSETQIPMERWSPSAYVFKSL